MKWPLVSLPEICRPKQWPTIPKTKLLSSGYPVFGANGQIGYYNEYNHKEPTILITCRGATCGSINICGPKSYVTGNAMALDALDESKADLRFLVYALKGADFSSVITGVAQPQITRQSLARLQIPLPPLAEQKRIAKILDAADALRTKRRESLAQLDILLQSTFLELFGDPVTNPMGWEVVRCSALFRLPPRIGTITPAADQGCLVVRVGEVGQSRIAFERCGRVEISEKDFEKFRLETGDTIIARAIGSKNQLGKASFFGGFDEEVVIDSHVMRFRPDPTKCDGVWFYSLISSAQGKILLQQAGGATAVQFNINAKQASFLPVALPPLPLQHRFATIVESIEKQKARLRAHLTELDTLFASLQQRAFNEDL